MSKKQSFFSARQTPAHPPNMPNGAVSGLVSAASIDPVFCRKLLTDPRSAIETGWHSETFEVTPSEMELLLSVQNPADIADFARQLVENFNE